MTPENQNIEQQDTADAREQFVPQVEDHSLPAGQVLNDQQEVRVESEAPALFVP